MIAHRLLSAIALASLCACSAPSMRSLPAGVPVSTQSSFAALAPVGRQIWGVTLDCGYKPGVDGRPGLKELDAKLPLILTSLEHLAKRPTVRVVFDERAGPAAYARDLRRLRAHAFIMGELLDSSHLADFDPPRYRRRAVQYFDTLSSLVDVWEIGNEVNGNWTSRRHDAAGRRSVGESIAAAYDEAHQRGLVTAVTFYDQPVEGKDYRLFRWVAQNLPARVRDGIDYALLSYYSAPHAVEWRHYFARMSRTFPNAKVGFGEMGGGDRHRDRLQTVQALYGLPVRSVSSYVGGYFYWYFCTPDGVPMGSDIWHAIDGKMQRGVR